MQPLSMRLRNHFEVLNFGYNSFFQSVRFHADRLFAFLKKLPGDRSFHVVAHSMGAIVVRAALDRGDLKNLNRFVMLAPPNNGSPIATRLQRGLGRVFPPLKDLSIGEQSYVRRLPTTLPCETGIIAANFDALVPVASTRLDSVVEHTTLNATHNSLLFSKKAAQLTTQFLVAGRFDT